MAGENDEMELHFPGVTISETEPVQTIMAIYDNPI